MDWQGQKAAEQLMQILLLSFAAAAFAVGYATGSFQTMVLTYAGGVVLTTLVTVPNWPCFNRHPLHWLDASEADKNPKPQAPAPAAGSKRKAKNWPRMPSVYWLIYAGVVAVLSIRLDIARVAWVCLGKTF